MFSLFKHHQQNIIAEVTSHGCPKILFFWTRSVPHPASSVYVTWGASESQNLVSATVKGYFMIMHGSSMLCFGQVDSCIAFILNICLFCLNACVC